jgi:intein-encoded DNA endonuclease-like protein
MLSWEALKEDVKRVMLLKLRGVLEKGALAIPNRYVKLFEELLDYSYKDPSSGYVYASALAVDLASP